METSRRPVRLWVTFLSPIHLLSQRLRRFRAQGRLLAVVYLPITTAFFCNLVGAFQSPLHSHRLNRRLCPNGTETCTALTGAVASKPFEASARNAELQVRSQFGDELDAEELRMLCMVGKPSCDYSGTQSFALPLTLQSSDSETQ